MKTSHLALLSAALSPSLASAQLLQDGSGNLPSCATNCPILVNAQSQCNGASSDSLSTWACFCKNVYAAAGQDTATICPTTCASASDEALVTSWFVANCGSDNGASEHGSGTSGGSASTSGAGSASSATASASPSDASGSDCSGSWWSCHWQWIVMVIVLAAGLTALGVGARWFKKRHDRKRDQMRQGFNTGITSRTAQVNDDKAYASAAGGAARGAHSDNRDSPARSREAFMPYGYNYARSESSRLGSRNDFTRGSAPAGDVEKGERGARDKLKKVLVRGSNGR